MLKRLFFFISLLLGHLAMSNSATAGEPSLEFMIDQVKQALVLIERGAKKEKLPSLDTVVLELNVTQTKKINGKISILIVSFGANKTNEVTNSIKLVLAPPEPGQPTNVSRPKLSQAIADSVLAAAHAIESAQRGSPVLEARQVISKISFVVTTDSEGGLAIEFPPFSSKIIGGNINKAVQTITVTYKVNS
jgi:hypothetical protein